MRQINDTSSIGDLINSSVFGEKKDRKINYVVKQSTIFSFWANVVGQKFTNFTKPYNIKYSKLYVSVKSPVIVQELSLYKSKLIEKINSYSKPLGIEIKDIIFNYKNFSATQTITEKGIEDKPIEIDKSRIEEVVVDSAIEEKIKAKIDKLKFLNEKQKENFIKKILSTYQVKAFQEN